MRRKAELDEKLICEEYKYSNVGIETLALKYHVGKKKINSILLNNNISHKKKGGQIKNSALIVEDYKIEKYPKLLGKHYIVFDENSDFTSSDIHNNCGVLTTYIKNRYNISIPTLYDRRKYYMETGNYWWEQWLKVRIEDDYEVKKCPYCEWTTKDLHNMSGAFEHHLNKCHSITKLEYIQEHNEDKEYFSLVSPILNRQMEEDSNKFVTCRICGKKLARINAHHLNTHNITTEEYIDRFGNSSILSNEYKDIASIAGRKANINSSHKFHSNIEADVKIFIESLGFETKSDRKILNGKEIDILIPSMNIAFEIDGLRWHNEVTKDKNYHLYKTELCKEHGITLYHIFEDEWEFKSEIVKSRIRNILGKTVNKIYARKCSISIVPKKESKDFLNTNHLQGDTISKVSYGLYYNGELVSIMTFGKTRKNLGSKNLNDSYELIRFCNKLNTNVIGGASKLLKHFIKEISPKKLISYADRRWSNGNLYSSIGFQHIHNSRPNYFYVIGHNRKNRFSFRKDLLIKQGFDPNKSEHQIMLDRGIYRIYDCGTMLFEYKHLI